MPVYTLLEEMPYEELLKWIEFFSRKPVGWREDHRTYMIMRAFGVKEKAETLFPTLKRISDLESQSVENDRAVPKGKFLEMMRKAKGGDKDVSF